MDPDNEARDRIPLCNAIGEMVVVVGWDLRLLGVSDWGLWELRKSRLCWCEHISKAPTQIELHLCLISSLFESTQSTSNLYPSLTSLFLPWS